jgi:fermentation-respiration switch protein FrsA (DUF1100 family)
MEILSLKPQVKKKGKKKDKKLANCNYYLKETSEVQPILIIHGTADNYVPYDMSVKMKNANPDGIDFLSVEGAGHGLSYMLDTDAYENAVKSFFKKVLA